MCLATFLRSSCARASQNEARWAEERHNLDTGLGAFHGDSGLFDIYHRSRTWRVGPRSDTRRSMAALSSAPRGRRSGPASVAVQDLWSAVPAPGAAEVVKGEKR